MRGIACNSRIILMIPLKRSCRRSKECGVVSRTSFDPTSLGLGRASLDDLRGGDPAHNAGVVRAVLAGQRGPVRACQRGKTGLGAGKYLDGNHQ